MKIIFENFYLNTASSSISWEGFIISWVCIIILNHLFLAFTLSFLWTVWNYLSKQALTKVQKIKENHNIPHIFLRAMNMALNILNLYELMLCQALSNSFENNALFSKGIFQGTIYITQFLENWVLHVDL